MTPEQFKAEWIGERDRREAKNFDSVIATVRDEARRAALDKCYEAINKHTPLKPDDRYGVNQALEIVDRLRTPPRTLGDVLGDIDVLADKVSSDNEWLRLTKVARTAVEGINAIRGKGAVYFSDLDDLTTKLTEIK